MLLLLIRHADAGEPDARLWPDDSLRPLTDKGRERQQRVGKRLKRYGHVPTRLLASPWLRAWETAQLTAQHAGGPAPVACAGLAEAPSLHLLTAAVGRATEATIVALVGHEPWMGQLASLLLAGDARRLNIRFPKSGVLGLETDTIGAGEATLDFFWRPKGG